MLKFDCRLGHNLNASNVHAGCAFFVDSRWHNAHAFGTTLLAAGYMRMKSSAQYREFAEECLQLAKQAKDQRHRKILDEMAEVWNKLAKEADKKRLMA
jgi:hypothetical protein